MFCSPHPGGEEANLFVEGALSPGGTAFSGPCGQGVPQRDSGVPPRITPLSATDPVAQMAHRTSFRHSEGLGYSFAGGAREQIKQL